MADYINPKHFDSLRNNIGLVKDLVKGKRKQRAENGSVWRLGSCPY